MSKPAMKTKKNNAHTNRIKRHSFSILISKHLECKINQNRPKSAGSYFNECCLSKGEDAVKYHICECDQLNICISKTKTIMASTAKDFKQMKFNGKNQLKDGKLMITGNAIAIQKKDYKPSIISICDLSAKIVSLSKKRLSLGLATEVLFAVDGTSSRFKLDPQKPRAFTPTGKWRSHVANFWTDFEGKAYYWHGPDSVIIGASKECQVIENGIVSSVSRLVAEFPNIIINFVGYSRGGYIVMEAARTLKSKGVKIHWMGLYDPVDSAFGYGKSESVSSNVKIATVAFTDPKLRSRWYFNTAENENVSKRHTDYTAKDFWCSHGGVGGNPWSGENLHGTNEKRDKEVSEKIDIWMRSNAIKAGVPIQQTNRSYYGFTS